MSLEDLGELTYVRTVIREKRLEPIIRSARLFQSDIARALDVSPQAVCRWCRGDRRPRKAVALRLAKILRELEGGENPLVRESKRVPIPAAPLELDATERKERHDEIERLRNLVKGYRIAQRRVLDYLDATTRDGVPIGIIDDGEEPL